MPFCHLTSFFTFGQKWESQEQMQLCRECFAKHHCYPSLKSVHITYGSAVTIKRREQIMINMSQPLYTQLNDLTCQQCCSMICSFDPWNGCLCWTHLTAKCQKKQFLASSKLQKIWISRSTLWHHITLCRRSIANAFLRKWQNLSPHI